MSKVLRQSTAFLERTLVLRQHHPGGNPGANLKSISRRYYLFEIALVCELTEETIHLPLGCLKGGLTPNT